MNKNRLKELAKNPGFIPGVYNWCDRWCEKCVVTSKCLNRAIEKESFSGPGSMDVNNAKFWKQIEGTFSIVRELLEETAKERGIDLNAEDHGLSDPKNEEDEKTVENKDHVKAARVYIKLTDTWFKKAKGLIKEKEKELVSREKAGLRKNDPFLEAGKIKDAMDVIGWYQYQIYAKLIRASSGELEEKAGELENYRDDIDGSAKVALLGLNHSIEAWEIMRQYFPEKADEVFDILLHLDRLRKKVNKEFPEANSFKRPGFEK